MPKVDNGVRWAPHAPANGDRGPHLKGDVMQFSPDQLLRTTVYDQSGNKVGKVRQVYLNDATGEPSWVTVQTGFFGTNESLVPLDDAGLTEDRLQVPFDKQVIRDAPNYDPGHHLEESDEDDLYRYYGTTPSDAATAGTSERQRTGPERDDRGQADMSLVDRGGPRGREGTGQFAQAHQGGQQPGTGPGQGSPRGGKQGSLRSQEPGYQDQPGGEYVSGPATAGDREQPGLREQAGGLEQSGGRERSGQRERSDSGSGDRGQGSSGPEDETQERELLERERSLLDRERDLLDRERDLAERKGAARPRLRRHNPG